MAYGPKLQFIKAGDALVADTVMQNFQTIVDFLRAIPANNLLQSKYTWQYQARVVGPLGAASTSYDGYVKINAGQTPVGIEIVSEIELNLAPLGAGETVTVQWQKCTPSNTSGPKAADVWVNLPLSIVFNTANTQPADQIAEPGVLRFAQTATLTNVPALVDGDWLRLVVTNTGPKTVFNGSSQINVKNPLRS